MSIPVIFYIEHMHFHAAIGINEYSHYNDDIGGEEKTDLSFYTVTMSIILDVTF